MSNRDELLLRMYEQMYRDIDHAYTVVWQSAATIFASFAAMALAEKEVISIDIAVSIVLAASVWFMLNIVECSYMYNRNLCIIANIERQFLLESDQKNIHYYFGTHRSWKMTSHLQNQMVLAVSIMAIVMLYHFSERVWPAVLQMGGVFAPSRAIPYVVLVILLGFFTYRFFQRRTSYREFLRESPGKLIDTTGVTYGVGHRV